MTDAVLYSLTHRASTLVTQLRQIARVVDTVDEATVINDLMALELEVAALAHEAQMREVRKWLAMPLRGRVTRPPVLSTDIAHAVPVERMPTRPDPPPLPSGIWTQRQFPRGARRAG